jgi:galactokinase
LLDCRSLDFKLIPIPKDVQIVICNTMVKHELASNEYNRRREECDQGVKILSKSFPEIRALRDVTAERLKQHASEMPETIYKRCLHVVQENQRTLDFAECLTGGDLDRVGELMRASHQSLRDLYEVSCSELDIMVEAAQGLPGQYGSRMTGGGFGGCTVNLVSETPAPFFAKQVAERYRKATGINPDVYICSAADGAGRAS